ncbi:MAG: sulfur carrier protein ThiS [Sterolibacteriaceae bacterium]|nr:sulfur carrier protein ThiS [Sterolibacteriaceae bacterium]
MKSLLVEPGSGLRLTINGAAESLASQITVAQLLAARGLAGKRVAVERNGEIVPRGLHEQTQLADGDRLEIVVAVGGG